MEVSNSIAVPVPEPIPVAVNVSPTVLELAPIKVKSVVPIETILYSSPITNDPAVSVSDPLISAVYAV